MLAGEFMRRPGWMTWVEIVLTAVLGMIIITLFPLLRPVTAIVLRLRSMESAAV